MYLKAEDLGNIADKVLADHPELEANKCVIQYLWSDKNKKHEYMNTNADCYKVPDKARVFSDIDFIITFYDIMRDASEEKKYRVMLHELMHAGCDEGGRKYIRPHDLEDFKDMINLYGTDWHEV